MVPTDDVVMTPEHPFVVAVLEAIRVVYGERLVSVALFGSVARRTARPDSDLDLLLVVRDLPCGRRARLATFGAVEEHLRPMMVALVDQGLVTDVMPVLRTPAELREPTPLLLDLTEDAIILEDHGGTLQATLDDLRTRLRRLGSRRIWDDEGWYWDLKPTYRRGEDVEI